jgi:hypothetical protein
MSFMEFFRLAIALIALAAAPGQVSSRESPPLPDFPFDQPGEYEFHFRQVRSREVTLVLEVQSLDGPPNRAVRSLGRPSMELTGTDGFSKATASGTLAAAK